MAIVARPIRTDPSARSLSSSNDRVGKLSFEQASSSSVSSSRNMYASPPSGAMPQQQRQQSVSPPVVTPQPRRSPPPSSSSRNVLKHFDDKRQTQTTEAQQAPLMTGGVDIMNNNNNHVVGHDTTKRSTRSTDGSTSVGTGDTAESASWRKYGKKFRANLVLADEAQGENAFTLSESCTIERYYRVADRVLQQFLSSDISNRDGMIESYLIGHRLFKFISIALPTHNDYFSPEEELSSLRIKSQNQLIELLEYMEELELMIDEMEYNHRMMTNLNQIEQQRQQQQQQQQQQRLAANGHFTDETMSTSRSMSMEDVSEEKKTDDVVQPIPVQSPPRPPLPQQRMPSQQRFKQPSVDSASVSNQNISSDDSVAILEDIGDLPSAKNATQAKRGVRSESPQEFAKRVAAVVAASSSDGQDVPSSASLTMRSAASAASFDSFTKKTNGSVVKPPPITPRKSAVTVRKKEAPLSPSSGHQTLDSWGNSTLGDLSDPFAHDFQTQSSNHIDLLMDDPEFDPFRVAPKPNDSSRRSRTPSQKEKMKLSMPQLESKNYMKQPPSSAKIQPRKLDAKLASVATPKRRSLDEAGSATAASGMSSDVFFAVEDQSGLSVPSARATLGSQLEPHHQLPRTQERVSVSKSRIEARLESAARSQAMITKELQRRRLERQQQQQQQHLQQPQGYHDRSLSRLDDSSIVDGDEPTLISERRLVHQFRGCIRCLVD